MEARMINIIRPVYTFDEYKREYESVESNGAETATLQCSRKRVCKLATSYLPAVKVIRKYDVKDYSIGDVFAGLTVIFIHLSQCLALGLLAGLQPIYGLYTSFFPVSFYMIVGTSPYISLGPTANMAIFTRPVVETMERSFIDNHEITSNSSINSTDIGPSADEILAMKVSTAAACSILSGLFLAILGFFKLGFLMSYLSASFIGGFTTASAVTIASGQVENLFGVRTESFVGVGGVLSYIDLFKKIDQVNIAELVISIICLTTLFLVKIGINERFKEKLKFPVPVDFIVVIAATCVSYFAELKDKFNIATIGPIGHGFQAPSLPRLDNAANILPDAVAIALVSLTMTITMAKLTAKTHGNKIDESQELFSYGVSNIFSGCLGCFPSANASTRTGILTSLGSKTTLNGLSTITVFLMIILVVGNLFSYIPSAVLASIIIISTKDLILQYRNLLRIWRINKYDFVIWIVTNMASIFLDLFYGLMIGLGASFLFVVIQIQMESGYLIDVASNGNVLIGTKRRCNNTVNKNFKTFKFPTNLYFATAEKFKKQMYNLAFDPDVYIKMQKRSRKCLQKGTDDVIPENCTDIDVNGPRNTDSTNIENEDLWKPKFIIIDCSMISYMDMTGTAVLLDIISQYSKMDVTVYLTGVQSSPLNALSNSGLFDTFSRSNVFFDVFDALEMIKQNWSCVSYL